MFKSTILLALIATTVALPTKREDCTQYATVSDAGFYAAASIPSLDFPNDEPYYENQILQWHLSEDSSAKICTLVGNFDANFPIKTTGDTALDVYQRGGDSSSQEKTKIGSVQELPVEDGKLDEIQSLPIATFPCSDGITLEFQLALSEPGTYASIAFLENADNGFFILSC